MSQGFIVGQRFPQPEIPEQETEVFIATYGTTTSAEIEAAYTAGKAVFCMYDSALIPLYRRDDLLNHHFTLFYNDGYCKTYSCSNDVWSLSKSVEYGEAGEGGTGLELLGTITGDGTTSAIELDVTHIDATKYVRFYIAGYYALDSKSSLYVYLNIASSNKDIFTISASGSYGSIWADIKLGVVNSSGNRGYVVKNFYAVPESSSVTGEGYSVNQNAIAWGSLDGIGCKVVSGCYFQAETRIQIFGERYYVNTNS